MPKAKSRSEALISSKTDFNRTISNEPLTTGNEQGEVGISRGYIRKTRQLDKKAHYTTKKAKQGH
ncbi:CMF_collapsed_G0013040.mRNA.1.CDS.1 [Saccharomyces cerevisiae]|nr:CMF_collapsed_G0013040.mRNA.1.CDS.1 [Saccharomyces cerevisiae]